MIWRIKRCVENLCFVTLVPPLFTHIFTLLLKVQPWVDVFFPAFPTVGTWINSWRFPPPKSHLSDPGVGSAGLVESSRPQHYVRRSLLSFFLLIYFKIPLVGCFTVNCECINIYIQNMFICDICIHIYISCIWYTAPCGVRFCQSNCTKPTWTWDKQTGLLGITKR